MMKSGLIRTAGDERCAGRNAQHGVPRVGGRELVKLRNFAERGVPPR